MLDLIFASNNPHKVKEIGSIIGPDFRLSSLADLEITDDIPENELTLEGNALAKARYVHRITGKNVFADDTGLETEALNGMPGVHSARFAGESKNSDANIGKLQSLLQGKENRKARFRTVIALVWNSKEYLFDGTVSGEIIKEKRGTGGFGYDPVFVPEGRNKTFAEMSLEEKNTLSHRARAFEKLREFLVGIARQAQ
ncbi:MAG: RdgB/HAM1 family non-canonical purine NTP pyrophosphatase [Chloroflexota bacterium]